MLVRGFAWARWMRFVALCLMALPAWPAFGESITYTNGAAAIYGAPTVYGDSLLFNPTAYSSRSSGANGVDMVDGLFRVWMNCAAGIEDVTVQEGGAWFFFGPASDATQAFVGAFAAELVITEVNGLPLAGGPFTMIPGAMTFTPASSEVGSRTFKASETVLATGWQGVMAFNDLSDALVGTPYQGGRVTGAMLVFDNILATSSQAGTIAYIDKKWVSITGTQDTASGTPEPGALVLLATTSTLMLTYQVRKRSRG